MICTFFHSTREIARTINTHTRVRNELEKNVQPITIYMYIENLDNKNGELNKLTILFSQHWWFLLLDIQNKQSEYAGDNNNLMSYSRIIRIFLCMKQTKKSSAWAKVITFFGVFGLKWHTLNVESVSRVYASCCRIIIILLAKGTN